jgi:hypothetical protein
MTARGFVLGSYLLTKGSHTFLNMWIGQEPQWFPEYGVDLGPALEPLPRNIDALRVGGGLYVRAYAHGGVAVNPTDQSHRLSWPRPVEQVVPVGGGALDSAAPTRGWGLRFKQVTSAEVPAHGAVIWLSG